MRQNLVVLISLAGIALVAADYSDDNNVDAYAWRFGRQAAVRRCPTCAAQGECLVMGMQRYSEPVCEPFGVIGSPCRMGEAAEPENKTLHMPDASLLVCDNVYMQFCPCQSGLVCAEGQCKPMRYEQDSELVGLLYGHNDWTTEIDDNEQELTLPGSIESEDANLYQWRLPLLPFRRLN